MVDEKEKKEPEKIVGLEDEQSQKAVPGKMKKLLLPGIIAVSVAVIATVVFLFMGGDQTKKTDEISETATESSSKDEKSHIPDDSQAKNDLVDSHDIMADHNSEADISDSTADSLDYTQLEKMDFAKYDIDTGKIMEELGFLYAKPEDEFEQTGLTPQDSIDTLNWIEENILALEARERAVTQKENELKILEENVTRGLAKIEQAESSRIINLARLYDGMKPDNVAQLFANLSDEVVISILPRMKPANASKILASMPPKRAALISTQMITVLEDK